MPSPRSGLLDYLRRLSTTAASDHALLTAHAVGDREAFRVLVARHGPLVLGVCRRILGDDHAAEDAFQAVFLALARGGGSIRRPGTIAAWLFGTARRLALKARTAAARRRHHEAGVVPRKPSDPPDELTARELFAALDDEVARLPEAYRLPLLLVYWEGLTQAETARRLGWTSGSVKGRLERGRARLGERLARRGFAPGALLVAPLAAVAVPRELLAATAALAANPWSKALPAAVVALAAGGVSMKLVSVAAVGVALVGAGLFAATWLAGGVSERSDLAPVAHALGSGDDVQPAAPRVDAFGDPLPPGALLRLGSSLWRNTTYRSNGSPRLTPDGRAVLVGTHTAVIMLDFDTGREVRRFECGTVLRTFTLGPDGDTLITAVGYGVQVGPDGHEQRLDDGGNLRVWDLATGRERRRFPAVPDITGYLVADRQYVALAEFTGRVQGTVFVYELATGREALRYGGYNVPEGICIPVGFVPGAGRLVMQCLRPPERLIQVLDLATGRILQSRTLPQGRRVAVTALSPDGRWLWVRGDDATIRLWETETGREHDPLTGWGHGPVRVVTFAQDGRTMVSAGSDGTIRPWDLTTGRESGRLATHSNKPYHLSLSADGRRLIAAFDSEDVIHRYDVATGRELPLPNGHLDAVHAVAFAPDGKTLYTGSGDNTVRVWDATTGRELRHWHANQFGGVDYLAVSPDGRRIVTANLANDHNIRIWDAAKGVATVTVGVGPNVAIRAVTFTPDGRTLAVSFGDRDDSPESGIRLWDVATGAEVRRLSGPPSVDGSLAVTPDGRMLVAGGGMDPTSDRSSPTRLFNLHDGRPLRTLDGPVDRVVISPDGRMLAGAGPLHERPCPWRLTELATGQERLRFGSHPVLSAPLVFSPDGRLLATLADSKTSVGSADVILWDVSTGREAHRFRGPGTVSAFAFSPDGRTLASTNYDSTITLWDMTPIRARPPAAPASADLPALWDALAGGDAAAAYRAIVALRSADGRTVDSMRGKLRAAVAVPADRLTQLIADLDTPAFATRQQATVALANLAEQAEPALRRALAGTPPLELRQRAERLLADLEGPVPPSRRLQEVRAVEVLEGIAAPEARALLEEWAKGDPAARLTREATASLERLRLPD